MFTMLFPDDISVFAFYLTMQVAQLPEHAPSQLTPHPNLPRSPLWSYWMQRYWVGKQVHIWNFHVCPSSCSSRSAPDLTQSQAQWLWLYLASNLGASSWIKTQNDRIIDSDDGNIKQSPKMMIRYPVTEPLLTCLIWMFSCSYVFGRGFCVWAFILHVTMDLTFIGAKLFLSAVYGQFSIIGRSIQDWARLTVELGGESYFLVLMFL